MLPSTRRIHRPAFSSLACRRSQFYWHHQCVKRVYTRATLVVVVVSAKQTQTHTTRHTPNTLCGHALLSVSLSRARACCVRMFWVLWGSGRALCYAVDVNVWTITRSLPKRDYPFSVRIFKAFPSNVRQRHAQRKAHINSVCMGIYGLHTHITYVWYIIHTAITHDHTFKNYLYNKIRAEHEHKYVYIYIYI